MLGKTSIYNYFKHKRKKMSSEDLIIRLRIKEDNRDSEKKEAHYPNEAKVVSSSRKPTTKGRAVGWDLKGESKFEGKCFNCENQCHKFMINVKISLKIII